MRGAGTLGKRIGYGWYYNWYAVDNANGLAPDGWRVPSDDDWKNLEMHLGMSQAEADRENEGPDDKNLRGTTEGGKLKSTINEWLSPNTGATNSTKFNATPGGLNDTSGVIGYNMRDRAVFWTSTLYTTEFSGTGVPFLRRLLYDNSGISRYTTHRRYGFPVRCVMDKPIGREEGEEGFMVDIDNNHYSNVVIGDLLWMTENLRTTRYKNGVEIPHIIGDNEWANDTTGARSAYNNDHYFVYPPNK